MLFYPKLTPWHIAQMRKTFVAWSTVPFVWSEEFCRTWTQIMFPEPRK